MPVAAGLAGTLLPALGYLPGAKVRGLSLVPAAELLAWPGLAAATRLSLTTGLAATALSLSIVVLFTAGWAQTRAYAALRRALSPLLSVPHAAAAFGLALLIAPSGWLLRLLSPWATGWDRPPDLLIVNDPWGVALTLGLVAKEVPFLFLMTLAALGQSDGDRRIRVARSLGHDLIPAWVLTVFPSVYAQIRLPVYAVLAFSMSVVDVALILGPSRPPTLAVQILRWTSDPDLSQRTVAAAGAVLQVALTILALAVWWIGERVAARVGRRLAESGARPRLDRVGRPLGLGAALVSAGSIVAGLAVLGLWSVAGLWQFPLALPADIGPQTWARAAGGLGAASAMTFWIALASTAIAVALVLACLEADDRGHPLGAVETALFLPLLVPQIAFLPALQTLFLSLGPRIGLWPVILAHLVFVLPYVYLSLRDPWRAWDPRAGRTAASLGAGPWSVLWRVRLPMLLIPVATASAVGFAVSVGQYLPTLLIGGGRVTTLTTEAVALASGGDRRIIGVYALAQTAAALLPFAVAISIPRLVYRNRRGCLA